MASDTSFANLLECPICYEQFKTPPKQLPCKHTLCEACLRGLVQYNSIICPECREESPVPPGGVAAFPNDLTMQRFLEHHRTKALQTHTGQPLLSPVKKPGGESPQHNVLDIHGSLRGTLLLMETDKEVFTKANHSLQEERQRYQQWRVAAQKRITDVLDHVEGIVRQRKVDLLKDIETIYQRALLSIETEEVKVEVKKQGMDKLCSALRDKLTLSAAVGTRNDQQQILTMLSQAQAVDASLQKGIELQLTQLNLLETGMDDLLAGIRGWGQVAATPQVHKLHPPTPPPSLPNVMVNPAMMSSQPMQQAPPQSIPAVTHPSQSTPVVTHPSQQQSTPAVTHPSQQVPINVTQQQTSVIPPKPPTQVHVVPAQVQQPQVQQPQQQRQQDIKPQSLKDSQGTPVKVPNPSHIEQQHSPSSRYMSMGQMSVQFGYEGGPGLLSSPLAVTELPNGNLAVTNGMTYEIKIFDSQGHHVKSVNLPAKGSFKHGVTGLTVHPSGHICASNPDRREIQLISFEGQVKGHIRFKVSIGEEKFCPWGVACSPQGVMYVCDRANHRIRVFNATGAHMASFGGRGKDFGKLDYPTGVAVMPNGEVAVADSNNHRIQVFTPEGGFVRSFGVEGSGLGELKTPSDISVDQNGYIVVSEMTNNRIQVFTPAGQPLVTFGKVGAEGGQFASPRGITLTRDGRLLVCDTKNDRVQIFK